MKYPAEWVVSAPGRALRKLVKQMFIDGPWAARWRAAPYA